MNKFTPAPWKAVQLKDAPLVEDASGHFIAYMSPNSGSALARGGVDPLPVAAANARLIAAAPELYEALQRIVDLSEGYPLLQAELDIPLARAALAKVNE